MAASISRAALERRTTLDRSETALGCGWKVTTVVATRCNNRGVPVDPRWTRRSAVATARSPDRDRQASVDVNAKTFRADALPSSGRSPPAGPQRAPRSLSFPSISGRLATGAATRHRSRGAVRRNRPSGGRTLVSEASSIENGADHFAVEPDSGRRARRRSQGRMPARDVKARSRWWLVPNDLERMTVLRSSHHGNPRR